MVRRCKGGNSVEAAYNDVEVKFTLEEWLDWAVPQYELFENEHPNKTPHVSRIGDSGDYEFDNIKIKPSEDNWQEQKRPKANYRTLKCPVCDIKFSRRANKVDHKIKNGKKPCCGRECGYVQGKKSLKGRQPSLVRQCAFNAWIEGSNPSRPTILK